MLKEMGNLNEYKKVRDSRDALFEYLNFFSVIS